MLFVLKHDVFQAGKGDVLGKLSGKARVGDALFQFIYEFRFREPEFLSELRFLDHAYGHGLTVGE